MKIETALIHHGNFDDGSGAVMPPIVLSTTFERGEDGLSYPSGYIYSRYGTPNRTALEDKLTILENGVETITFSSGLTAIMAIFQSLGSGSHVIMPDDVYFGARSILEKLFPHWGLTFSLVDMAEMAAIEAAIQPDTKLIWIESPSNPQLKLTDIQEVVKIAKAKNILTACDNTWATPYFTKPLDLGVDVSMHSTTKYLGGHSDVLGGSLTFKEQGPLSEFIRTYQKTGGAVPSPFDCWLLCRSLATFAARMPIHANNAMQLARFLEQHPAVEKVMYPGLETDRFHAIANKQMKGGYGGMLSILIKGGQAEALQVCSKLKLFKHATSLGGVESLIEHRKSIEGPSSLSPENLLRISAGIEAIEDLIADFETALALGD
jgi:cystathionine gamma-synthase